MSTHQSNKSVDSSRVKGSLNRGLELVGGLAILVMLTHVVLEVFLRSFFNTPIPGTLEYVSFWYIVVIAFVGMWLAQRRNEHISVTLMVDKLRSRARTFTDLFGNVLMLGVLGMFAYFGFTGAMIQTMTGEYSGATMVPVWPMRWVVPIMLSAWFIVLVRQTVSLLTGSKNDRRENDA